MEAIGRAPIIDVRGKFVFVHEFQEESKKSWLEVRKSDEHDFIRQRSNLFLLLIQCCIFSTCI